MSGPVANLSNPDAVGIPKQAKYPDAAAKFIEWFTKTETQAAFAGLDGPEKIWEAYPLPSHVSAVTKMVDADKLAGGDALVSMLEAPSRCSRAGRRPGTQSSPTRSTPVCMRRRPVR